MQVSCARQEFFFKNNLWSCLQCAPYLIRKIKYCIMFCWAWYTCCSLKKFPWQREEAENLRHGTEWSILVVVSDDWWVVVDWNFTKEILLAGTGEERVFLLFWAGKVHETPWLSFDPALHKEGKKIDSWGDVWMIRGDRNRVAGSRPGVASCLAWSCGVHVANQTAWSCCTVTPCPCKTEQASNHLTDVKKIWAAIMQLRKQPEDNILHFAIKKTDHFVFYIFTFLEGNLQYLKY